MATSAAQASVVLRKEPLQFPASPPDPFLFCAYHLDNYPAGDDKMQAPRRGNGAVSGQHDNNRFVFSASIG